MDIRVKLLNYCKSKRINKADFCRITGVPTSFFNRESGVTSTTLEAILSKFADLSAEWLGVPLHVIQRWTGHATIRAMQPYMDVLNDMKRREMSKFDTLGDFVS